MWTRTAILAELRRIAAQDGWPTAPLIARLSYGADLLTSIERAFGDLHVARRAAALSRREPKYDTPDAVVEGLQELASSGTRITPQGLADAGEARLVSAIYRNFPNFAAARETAGIAPPAAPSRELSIDDAALEVRALQRELGRAPRRNELPPGARSSLERHHGSYTKALRALDVEEPEPAGLRWTRDTIVARLRELHQSGVRMTSGNLNDLGHFGLMLGVYRRFETFEDARRAAGIPKPGPMARVTAPNTRVSNARIRRARERYARGDVTQREIAIALGVSLDVAHRILCGRLRVDAGGPIHAPSSGRVLTGEQVKTIRQRALTDGVSRAELARAFGVAPSTITRMCEASCTRK